MTLITTKNIQTIKKSRMKPIYGSYKIQQDYLNNPTRLTNKKEEIKMKFDWKKIWEIIKSILIALLTADSIRNL